MIASGDIDSLNKDFYLSKSAAAWYAEKKFVMPEEESFLRDFSGQIRGGTVLDIGIGAGRTTRYLLPLASNYTGVDYSPDMVEAARQQFPDTKLEVCDARDLSAYGSGQFDFVLFSFNGLDCLSDEGRQRALAEIHRVLKPGGLFAFSSHNRGKPGVPPWSSINLSWSWHPVRLLKNAGSYVKGIRNWLRSRQAAVQHAEYELRHDSSNHYTVPTYCIDKPSQAGQLERAGFGIEAIYDRKGNKTLATEPDVSSSWLFFVARKK